ncbi:MAG TPA: response regulator [Acidimicrobiia bacterium]|nr:response regulator [Acidimicrobiia bacterium]
MAVHEARLGPSWRPFFGLNGTTALLVVRDPDAADHVVRRLAATECRVVVARSTEDALARLRSARPDVVVSELELPDGDGIRLMRRLRARTPADGGTTPAVALLSPTSHHLATRALLAGYQAAIAFDATAIELLLAVADAHGRHVGRADAGPRARTLAS